METFVMHGLFWMGVVLAYLAAKHYERRAQELAKGLPPKPREPAMPEGMEHVPTAQAIIAMARNGYEKALADYWEAAAPSIQALKRSVLWMLAMSCVAGSWIAYGLGAGWWSILSPIVLFGAWMLFLGIVRALLWRSPTDKRS